MKFLKALFSLILSLLLAVFIVLTCFVYKVQESIKPENMQKLLLDCSIGEKLLGYEYLDENVEEIDFYTFICNNIQEPSALVLDFSLDKEKICHEAALEYVKDRIDSNIAFTNLNKLAQDLTDGYCNAAVEKGLINPNSNITYRTQKAWLTKKRGVLLNETIYAKYLEYLQKMADEGNICSLDIDQKNTIGYLLRTGKASVTTKNLLHKDIEDQTNRVCANALHDFVNDIIYKTNSYEGISKNSTNALVSEVVYGFFHLNDINDDDVRNGYVTRIIEESSESFVYPKIVAFLPSAENKSIQLPEYVSIILGLLTNTNLLYVLIGISAFLALLLLLINGGKSLLYIGMSMIIAGAVLYLLNNHINLLDNYLYSSIEVTDIYKTIIDKAIYDIMDNQKIAIILAGAGILMFIASFLFKTKKQN